MLSHLSCKSQLKYMQYSLFSPNDETEAQGSSASCHTSTGKWQRWSLKARSFDSRAHFVILFSTFSLRFCLKRLDPL